MIKTIIIENIQSHKKTVIDLDTHVNIFVGPSDSGKTAIIRALRWVFWNRPNTDVLKSKWEGESRVTIITYEGDTIIRTKGEYKLNDKSFKAFGTSVPDEIQRVLNISDINLQRQLDAPYLFSDTPGQIAQHFNKVAGLDKIDLGVSKVNAWIRDLSTNIKFKEEQVAIQQAELKQYANLQKYEIELEVLEEDVKVIENLRKKISKFSSLLTQLESKENEIEETSYLFIMEKEVDSLLSLFQSRDEWQAKLEDLATILDRLRDIDKEIKDNADIITIDLTELFSIIEEKKKLIKKINGLSTLINKITTNQTQIEKTEKKKLDLIKRFNAVFPNQCPLCGSTYKTN